MRFWYLVLILRSLRVRSAHSQSVEFPADREKPDREEQTVDKEARAYDGPKGLTHDAQDTGHDAQIGNALMENALEHDEREDQNAERGQDTSGGHGVRHGDQALSGSR